MKFKAYGTIVEHAGSGLKLPEQLARRIDELGKGLSKDFTYRRLGVAATDIKTTKLEDGSRTDVSDITTDAIDRDNEVILPAGLELEDYRKNPVVLFGHDYYSPPIGKCMWIKAKGNGLSACTKYAERPEGHEGPWVADAIFGLVQQEMLPGKSIGFIPTSMREPTLEEVKKRPELHTVNRIIDKGILLEYSVVSVPCNPQALMESVSKSIADGTLDEKTADILRKGLERPGPALSPAPLPTIYDPASIKAAKARLLADLKQQVRRTIQQTAIDLLTVHDGTV